MNGKQEKMKPINFVIGGLGGQGILFMTKILARTALNKGFNVLGAETHGMAQRGGSVVSHLKFGDAQSSLVKTGTADFLLALEEHEAYRNLPFLAKKGVLVGNHAGGSFPNPAVESYLKKNDIACHAAAAARIALELNAPLSVNLALLGYFATLDQCPFSRQELRETVAGLSPDPYRQINLKVFDRGTSAS